MSKPADYCAICIDTHRDGELCKPLTCFVSSETGECRCDYTIHESCLREWMVRKKGRCLICSGQLNYKKSRFAVWTRVASSIAYYIMYYLFALVASLIVCVSSFSLLVYLLVAFMSEFM